MPEHARLAIEAALPAWARASLPQLFRLYDVRDPARWPDHPILRDRIILDAVIELRARHVTAGKGRTKALRAACTTLGLSLATVRRRLERSRKSYLESGDKMSAFRKPAARDSKVNDHPSQPERATP